MTADREAIGLPQVARDIRTLTGRVPRTDGRSGVRSPFSGVLGLDPSVSDWPRPALSMLRLEPLVSPVLRTADIERDRSISSTRSELDTPAGPTDDPPETVRDLLDRERKRSAPEDRSNGNPAEPPSRTNRQRSRGVGVRDERPAHRMQSDEPTTIAADAPGSTSHPESAREPLTNPATPRLRGACAEMAADDRYCRHDRPNPGRQDQPPRGSAAGGPSSAGPHEGTG